MVTQEQQKHPRQYLVEIVAIMKKIGWTIDSDANKRW